MKEWCNALFPSFPAQVDLEPANLVSSCKTTISDSSRIGVLAAAVLWLCCSARLAMALPPPDADPALAPWFNDLRQPWTNALCCSMADCRQVESRLDGDHYEALIEGEWRRVPDHLILNRSDNPTGHAVACWTKQTGILCFVPAPES
jgi:hypothetical protein